MWVLQHTSKEALDALRSSGSLRSISNDPNSSIPNLAWPMDLAPLPPHVAIEWTAPWLPPKAWTVTRFGKLSRGVLPQRAVCSRATHPKMPSGFGICHASESVLHPCSRRYET